MALIPCPECNKQFSDKASACPHCGAPKTITAGNPPPLHQIQQNTGKTLTIYFDENNEKFNNSINQILINGTDYTANIPKQFAVPLPSSIDITFKQVGLCKYTIPATQDLSLEISGKGLLPRVILYNQQRKKIFKDDWTVGLLVISAFLGLFGIILAIVYKSKGCPLKFKTCLWGSIVGFIMNIILVFINGNL